MDARYLRSDDTELVNREYALTDTTFWEYYKRYLNKEPKNGAKYIVGNWKDISKADPDNPSGKLYTDLKNIRDEIVEGRRAYVAEQGIPMPNTLPAVINFDEPMGPRDKHGSAQNLRPSCVALRKTDKSASHAARPLALFDALRTDFSLLRLETWTGTDTLYFQDNILLVNNRNYAKEFVLRAIIEIYHIGLENKKKNLTYAKDFGRLVVSPPKPDKNSSSLDEPKKGFTVDYDWVIRRFSEINEETGEDIGLKRLVLLYELFQSGKSVEDLDPTNDSQQEQREQLAAYRSCLSQIEALDLIVPNDIRMPAYHYSAPENGESKNFQNMKEKQEEIFGSAHLPSITMIDIGKGPSIAKAVTDHLATLRPNCWIFVGRCGGLRKQQMLGDYVLATSYLRRDAVLDRHVPQDATIKMTRAVLHAFEEATKYYISREEHANVRQPGGPRLKNIARYFVGDNNSSLEEEERQLHLVRKHVRNGTVISTNDRNWETLPVDELLEKFNDYRAIAIDMESAAIATNGYRYRVQNGAFLIVSEKPLDGTVRLRNLRNSFLERRSGRQLMIALGAIRWLQYDLEAGILIQYSRELRGTDDPPWD